MKHIGDALFVLALLTLAWFTARCTIKVEVPPWPDGGIVVVPPIDVPCVANEDAGWHCVYKDGGQ